MSSKVEQRQDTAVVSQTPPAPKPRPRSSAPKPMNAAFLFAVVALSITIVGLLYLVQTAQVASLGYELTRLERERAAAALENQQLTFTVANFESLPRVEQLAFGPLAMQPVEDYRFLIVPLPAHDELPAPEPLDRSERSLGQRIWERLTGQSTASNTGSQP